MKLLLGIVFIVCYITTASAGTKVTCTVDSPCGWLEPIPVEPFSYLGYCVDRIEGNQNELTIFRSDGNGNNLDQVLLSVQTLNKDKISATNKDNSIELSVSQYGENLAGGILFKTERDPYGLGLYLYCEVN